jgi:TRAP-type C4-dicarboxylate transport system permease small subunit
MSNLVKKIANIFDRTLDIMGVTAIIILVFIMLSISYQVVVRFLFGRGTVVVLELTEYSLLFITFLAAALLLRREDHVTMDLVINWLKPRNRAVINAITSIIGGILFLIIAWYSILVTWERFETGAFMPTPLTPPVWPIIIIIPIGSFMFSIQFFRRSYDFLRSWRGLRE